ncbi:MAG: TylF/MycF/NovP-related O-methyltransferase [Planctomycetota bacterium]
MDVVSDPSAVVVPDPSELMPITGDAMASSNVPDRKRFMGEGWWDLWHELGWPAPDHGLEVRTRLGWERLAQLVRLAEHVERQGVAGDYAEFGVWRGGAMCFVGAAWERLGARDRRLLGFDSFEGLPATGERDGDKLWEGQFEDTSADMVRSLLDGHGLGSRVELFEGWFDDTVSSIDDRSLAMVHVDCDLYDPARMVLERVWPRLSVGGVVVFDDYRIPDTPGVTIAVEEFFASRPETVEMTPGLRYSAWVVKRG